MGYLLVWALIVAALWLIHFSSVRRENELSRSPHPPAGASLPRTLAPAPFSATDPCGTDGTESPATLAANGTSAGSVAVLSAREQQAMEINREAVERLYGGAA